MDGRQLLADHIARQTSQAKIAREAKCSEGHLSLFLQGKRRMSVSLAKRVSAATGGVVPARALVPEVAEMLEAAE